MNQVMRWGIVLIAAAGLIFLLTSVNSFDVIVSPGGDSATQLPVIPEAEAPEDQVLSEEGGRIADIEPQDPLRNPPEIIKAVYATSWSASSETKMDYLIGLINGTELNAIVIDIKDFSGLVLYDIDFEDVEEYEAKEVRIFRINALIKRLHDEGIYVIARQTVFQDPALVAARPDLAVRNNVTGGVWEDRKGLSWIDPASKEAWDYNIAIARDASNRGFDEINFDYIRFPSDGDLSVMGFPFYDIDTTLKKDVIGDFFAYLRSGLDGIVISADLFGLVTVNYDGLGIGQIIEDAYRNFDYVSPMVYPSHYAKGFIGYSNPATQPYEVVNYSIEIADTRLNSLQNATGTAPVFSQLRPWLQDFDLGADYTSEMVRAQITAVNDVDPSIGWMLWDPRNNYTRGALHAE